MRSFGPWLLVFLLPLAACTPTGDDDDATEDAGPPADPDVDSYVPDNYSPDDPARVIFLGDSITGGTGASSGSLAYPALLVDNDSEWPDHGDIDLQSLYGDLDVVDVSVGGATTVSVLQQQLPNLSNQLGDSVSGESIVVMTVGGNDMQAEMISIITGGDDVANALIAEIVDRMHTFVDYFDDADRFPDGARVYIANVYEPTDNQGQVSDCFFGIDIGGVLHNFEDANDAIRGVAEDRGIAMVDMRGHFLGHGFFNAEIDLDVYHPDDPTRWFDNDCIHPNDRGHHELRRLFHSAIAGVDLPLEPVPDED